MRKPAPRTVSFAIRAGRNELPVMVTKAEARAFRSARGPASRIARPAMAGGCVFLVWDDGAAVLVDLLTPAMREHHAR